MLPEKDLIDCCWHSNYIFRDHGSIHYNELIAYWMMEGYLGEVNCIEKAYERGHRVLMELLDLGILKKQRVHDVIMEGAMLNLADGRRWRFFETASLGMAEVFRDGEWEGLGSITLADAMIKTLCTGKRRSAISTPLLDGNRLFKEFPGDFDQSNMELQVLVIFNLALIKLPLSLAKMKNLNVLVLRGCDLLVNIDDIGQLKTFKDLRQLLLSHCSSLVKLPDLNSLTKLEVLDLSETKIADPPSLSNLSNLRRLLPKKCTYLKELPLLKSLSKLEELYLSGISSLSGTGANFLEHMSQLRILDLSETLLEQLPPLSNLKNLNHLSLADCPRLVTVPHLEALTELEFLDLSGTAISHPPNMKNIQGACSRKVKYRWSISSWPAETLTESDRHPVSLSDLDAKNTKEMQVCWIERCNKMESVFHVEKVDNSAKLGEKTVDVAKLEEISEDVAKSGDIARLEEKFLHVENLQGKSFENLKYLYLDCCPKFSSVFSPQRPENLEILQIKFCDNLDTLLESESAECTLPKLHTLHLLALPKLKSIGCKLPSLRSLKVVECPVLVNVLSSPQLPDNLEILQIKFCEKLEIVFEDSASAHYSLPNLHTLHLQELPNLRSIGGEFPPELDRIVRECPKLQSRPLV
ncbi:hypothetical protein F0562_018985 [Nyssa sinensis]|uniref:Disease resistance protein At4g27190-like leucine-rich repeats domain-containing protein n=1 Tax=Nyssa sinensis TaxID=561372 RepID=A0A5J4ZCC3_9ASTE|nr:hypothetical protein F0562_018985 [Nyssa sinensis]